MSEAVMGTSVVRYTNSSLLRVASGAGDTTMFCQPNNTADDGSYIEEDIQVRIERIVEILVPLLFGVIIVLGLFGNALVIIVVSANQQMRSTTNLLIINLAIADLLFIVFCVPFTAVDYIMPYWPFGDTWCKTVQYFIVVTAFASVYTLVLMSLDRFLAVVHPIASMSVRTERNASRAILILWAVILVSTIPVISRHGEVRYEHNETEHTTCIFLTYNPVTCPGGYSYAAFQISFFLTAYMIPLTMICALYFFMLFRLWRGVAPGGHISAESRRGKKRVTRMVVIVVANFAFCWFPIQVILTLKSLNMYSLSARNVILQVISHVLAYMNSCINPILYAFLSENFRKAFRKVIYCRKGGLRARGHMDGRPGDERSALTKTTRTNDIL
ncbi:allatostatin-A receptor [Bemisia tabaci]|uniref:allatostatin-A receptor n=1 Tax=Bemisia tabaci TaxID=7038 RepID=UPI003B285E71